MALLPVALALVEDPEDEELELPKEVEVEIELEPELVNLASLFVVVEEESFSLPAAELRAVDNDAGINHWLAPTLEHNEIAKLVALATSLPLHLDTKHSATSPDHCGITQKHPVSQYGHGVLSVSISTHSWAQSGNLVYIGSANPLMLAVFGTDGYVAQLLAETKENIPANKIKHENCIL